MPATRQLVPGDMVLVLAGSTDRAVLGATAIEVKTVKYAHPAGLDSGKRMAGTVVAFTDGTERVYNSKSEWRMA